MREVSISFVGAVGLPNRYGGFEAFLEHCAPVMARKGALITVTCDAKVYPDRRPDYSGVRRVFINVPANGVWSILHDFLAFFSVIGFSKYVVFLGVSGGIWFPLFRGVADLLGVKLLVNVDGVEWQRAKYRGFRKKFLWFSDRVAQFFSHKVVYDNAALREYVSSRSRARAVMIAYPGDYVMRVDGVVRQAYTALTVCRIEPENNIEMLILGALQSSVDQYVLVGNWEASVYGRELRERYRCESRLVMLDPVYEPMELARLREGCSVYIHGHSVGGTNPSLVEMLFYDCRILCFDVPYHRETTWGYAEFFSSPEELGSLLSARSSGCVDLDARKRLRQVYTREAISRMYIDACVSCQ